MQESSIASPAADTLPIQEPIVLNPGLDKTQSKEIKGGRGIFSTFGVLLAGWFFGNLILLGVLAVAAAISASSTGLVKVPFFTERFFGHADPTVDVPDEVVLETAQGKINKINSLSESQTIKSLEFSEEELNALFAQTIKEKGDFPLYRPKIDIKDGQFFFSGRLIETNAPVEITGVIKTSGLVASIELASAKFGKVSVPTFIASNLLNSYLSTVDLSLSGGQVPARSLDLQDGAVTLLQVSKPQ